MSVRMRRLESEEAGWISMCDLLLLLFAVGLLAAFVAMAASEAARREAAAARTERQADDQTIGELQARSERLRTENGDWMVVANTAKAELERVRNLLVMNDTTANSIEKELENVMTLMGEAQAAQNKAEASQRVADAARRSAEVRAREEVEAEATLAESATRRADDAAEAAAKLGGELVAATSALATAVSKAEALENQIKYLEGAVDGSGEIKQELLGIPGRIGNIVFVVDRSDSMNKGGRWTDAQRTVAGWIQHLPVKKSVLVIFDSGVTVLPSSLDDGRELDFDSRELPSITEDVRAEMISELEGMQPRGSTQTLRGLRRAMQFKDLDAIVLFTDGAPDPAWAATLGGDPRKEIYTLVEGWKSTHPEARVHTVGIGDYFNPGMRDFLLGIAKRGGGTFIGR